VSMEFDDFQNSQHFNCRMLLNKIPTRVNLLNRGMQLGDIMQEMEETTTHLFFTCKIFQRLWQLCDRWMGLSSIYHNQSMVYFQHFHCQKLNFKQNTIWKGM